MVSIHFNKISNEKNININSKEDLSEILDKIMKDIEEKHEKILEEDEDSNMNNFLFKMTLDIARIEFKHEILNYFYGKED